MKNSMGVSIDAGDRRISKSETGRFGPTQKIAGLTIRSLVNIVHHDMPSTMGITENYGWF